MISMTKLYDYLDNKFTWVFLVMTLFLTISFVIVYMYAIDMNDKYDNFINKYWKDIDTIQMQSDRIEKAQAINDNTITNNNTQIGLVHYFAELTLCPKWKVSYPVTVEFWWINPIISNGSLQVISIMADTQTDMYLPITGKYDTDSYDAHICEMKILSSSNK